MAHSNDNILAQDIWEKEKLRKYNAESIKFSSSITEKTVKLPLSTYVHDDNTDCHYWFEHKTSFKIKVSKPLHLAGAAIFGAKPINDSIYYHHRFHVSEVGNEKNYKEDSEGNSFDEYISEKIFFLHDMFELLPGKTYRIKSSFETYTVEDEKISNEILHYFVGEGPSETFKIKFDSGYEADIALEWEPNSRPFNECIIDQLLLRKM